MLSSIIIFDLAVVQTLELDFDKGLTALTGETGAGKSIMLTALGLALGNRADSDFVRPNCKRAEITIEFNLEDSPDALAWLEENDLDEDTTCLIRRVISADGKSKAFINNRPSTLQSLQSLSRNLLEIHGQHAHLTLLTNAEQRRLLDKFGTLTSQVDELNDVVRQWQAISQTLEHQKAVNRDADARIELLRYQIEELENEAIETLNYTEISEQQHRLTHLDSILNTAQSEIIRLHEDDQNAVTRNLDQSIQAFSAIIDFTPELQELLAMLTESRIQVEEAARTLRQFIDSQEPDPEQLVWLNDKLTLIHDLARKHQVKPEQLNQHLQTLREELASFETNEESLQSLQQQQTNLQQHYLQQAHQLSEQRKKLACDLSAIITESIQQLGMPQGQFEIDIQHNESQAPQLYGADQIQFLIASNPGLPPKPINKIASGGELSRISLAIQVAVSQTRSVSTMIFDEVDSGIGGGTAQIVGNLLRQLGSDRQILCVTHLPQVAAQAHQQLLVKKSTDGDSTQTSVIRLSEHERAAEIARMLGGVELTEQTFAHAKEMLNWKDTTSAV